MKTLFSIISAIGLILTFLIVPYDFTKAGIMHDEGGIAYVLVNNNRMYGFVGLYNYGDFKAYALFDWDKIDFVNWYRIWFQAMILTLPLRFFNKED